jgi:hypothetical protein
MSIEENEDITVRGFLGSAFIDAEPPLRDLASGSIARGDAARSRNRRLVAAGGAVLTVAAVIGTCAVVTGATHGGHGNPNPVQQVTSEPPPVKPTGYLGFGPSRVGIDKLQDLQKRLPAALQPLLPAGVTVGQAQFRSDLITSDQVSGIMAGPTGTNEATMWVGLPPPDDRAGTVRQIACRPGGTCQTRTVAGGTVYLDEHINTAADQALTGSGFPHDALKPGTEKTIVSRSLSMTFVPNDLTAYAFNFKLTAAIAKVPYVDHEPADAEPGIPWPPTWNTPPAFDASGLMMSADDLVAMLAKPGLAKVEYLLDARTPVSKDTAAEVAATEARVTAAAEAALPAGLKVTIDWSKLDPMWSVTGPTGDNQFYWMSTVLNPHDRQQEYGGCSAGDNCTSRPVPGGTLMVRAVYPNSTSSAPSDYPSSDHYVFLPDDLSKPVLDMMISARPVVPQSGTPDPSSTDPTRLPVIHGPFAPLQVTPDQFLDAVQSGRLETAIATTKSLVDALR